MAAWGRLRVIDGAHEGTVFVLEREVHTLGRGQASDFRLADPTVSRVQAEFRISPEGVVIAGLSDKNPVWVNGEPAGRGRPLIPGDKVQCGLVHLLFEEPPPPSTEPPPSSRGPALALTSGTISPGSFIPSAPAAPAAGGTSCARCGARELPGARFCGSCGARIGGGSQVPLPTMAPSPATAFPGAISASPMALTPPAPMHSPTVRNQDQGAPVRTDTMARPPEPLAEPLPSATLSFRGPPPGPGTVLKGRFELRRHIGLGRVSEVFEAFDRETKKPVAVKILVPALSGDPEARDWFFHGANALIVATHPHLLRVHSVHESGEICFSVTDLLAGVTLRDQLRSRPATAGGWAPEEVRRVGTALCEALAKLHAVGAHGEVAPGNIWIDAQGGVTLMDAGLSAPPGKAVRWPPSTDLAAALYDAPEVLRGSPPEPRSDLYSVGAILYQMLTGELPAGLFPPLARSPAIPRDLAQAVDRAMSPRAAERFASAEEMARFLTGEMETQRSASRRRLVLGGSIAAGLLCVAASAVLWLPGVSAWRRRTTADPALVARVEERRVEGAKAEEEVRGLGPLADGKVLDAARESFRRGAAAREEWRLEAAEAEYAGALQSLQDEARAVRDRQALIAREKESAAALDAAIDALPKEGGALESAVQDLARRVEEERVPPAAATTLAKVEHAERAGALARTKALAEGLRDEWAKFVSGSDPVLKVKEARAKARSLSDAGRPAEADALDLENLLILRKALAEGMVPLLRKAATGDERRQVEGRAAEALDAATRAGAESGRLKSSGDMAGAAATWTKALAALSAAVAPSLETTRGDYENLEKAMRCPSCAGEGKCRTCAGSGSVTADCAKCGGRGFFDVDCPKCKGKKVVDCPRCSGKGTVPATCTACNGLKTVVCPACHGVTPKCSVCKGEGQRPCLRCNGTGTSHAAGEPKSCPECGGKGKKVCNICGGKKTEVCPKCKGQPSVPCAVCSGTGTVPVPCPDCKGGKTQTCPDCAGTGRTRDDCAACKDGKVPVPCPACAGKGVCPACGGRGRKE